MGEIDPDGRPSVRPELLRAARAALAWSHVEAGSRAGISVSSVLAAEGKGARAAPEAGVAALRRAYEAAGVVLFDDAESGAGLRLTGI